MIEFADWVQRSAWGIAVLIGLTVGLFVAINALSQDDPQPDIGKSGCRYEWVSGPYGQTLVCR